MKSGPPLYSACIAKVILVAIFTHHRRYGTCSVIKKKVISGKRTKANFLEMRNVTSASHFTGS